MIHSIHAMMHGQQHLLEGGTDSCQCLGYNKAVGCFHFPRVVCALIWHAAAHATTNSFA